MRSTRGSGATATSCCRATRGSDRPFPRDLTEQLDALPELAAAFGFVAAKVSPFEADDLLASGVERELAAGGSAVTMTSDRDAYQLVGERSTVLVPVQGRQAAGAGRPEAACASATASSPPRCLT